MPNNHIAGFSLIALVGAPAVFLWSRIRCPLCLLFYTLLLGVAAGNLHLHEDTSLVLSLMDAWLAFALAPFVLYLLHRLAKFVWALRRGEIDIPALASNVGKQRLAYTYLSPFLIQAILDRWRSYPRAPAH